MNPFSTLKKLIKSKPYIDELQKERKEFRLNPSNWRTTASGVIAALLQLSQIWIPAGSKAAQTVNVLSVLFVALGLYKAADNHDLKELPSNETVQRLALTVAKNTLEIQKQKLK